MNIFKKISNHFRTFKQGIINLYLWFPIIWSDRDYDEHYIYKTLQFKIKRTRLLNEKNMRYVGVEKNIHYMKVCEILLDRLMNDDYYSSFNKIYEEKWGKSEFYFGDIPGKDDSGTLEIRNDKIITEEDKKQSRLDRAKNLKMSRRNRENDKKYLFKILNDRIDTWWD